MKASPPSQGEQVASVLQHFTVAHNGARRSVRTMWIGCDRCDDMAVTSISIGDGLNAIVLAVLQHWRDQHRMEQP